MDTNRVAEIVEDTRKELQAKRSGKQKSDVCRLHDDYFAGYCVSNARALARNLCTELDGVSVQICYGGMDVKNTPRPDSYDEATELGAVHHWVVVESSQDKIYTDLFSPSVDVQGPLISRNLPEIYIDYSIYKKIC